MPNSSQFVCFTSMLSIALPAFFPKSLPENSVYFEYSMLSSYYTQPYGKLQYNKQNIAFDKINCYNNTVAFLKR